MLANLFATICRESYLYPNAVRMPGHLHIIYNALRESFESLDCAKTFMDDLRAIEAVLSNKQLWRRFAALCLPEEHQRKLFEYFPVIHCDWRWEFLSEALTGMLRMLPALMAHWDEAKLLGTESGKLDRQVVKGVSDIFKRADFIFPVLSEMLRIVGVVVERFAKKLEGCWCHESLWTSGSRHGRKRKATAFKAATGHDNCPWKGRMGPWLVALGIRSLMDSITNATSTAFETLLEECAPRDRERVLCYMQYVKAKLRGIYSQTFAFWDELPYKLFGVFWSSCGALLLGAKRY